MKLFVEFENENDCLRFCYFSRHGIDQKKGKQKPRRTLPWWWIFIIYGLCILLVALSIFFIIARGIEFGDLKTQQWLGSILTGFFSSVLFTQPLKVR